MIRIGKIPTKVKPFFDTLRIYFTKRQWEHFYKIVLAITIAYGRKNIKNLYRHMNAETHRQKVNEFLTDSPWDGEEVLQETSLSILYSLKPRKGDLLEILIDPSGKGKRGSQMEAADHSYWDPIMKKTVFGHRFLMVAIMYKGVILPWKTTLIPSRDFCKSQRGRDLNLRYKTKGDIASDVLYSLPQELSLNFKIRVLFDAGLFNKKLVSACKSKGFSFITTAQSNRAFFPENYKGKRKLSSYAYGVLRYEGREIRIQGSRGQKRYRVAERIGTMRGVGKVKVIFSKRLSDGNTISIVTDELTLTPRKAVLGHRNRWNIEVLIKDFKQHLGLGDYQTGWYEGIVHHLHLVSISYLLLIHLGIKLPSLRRNTKAGVKIVSVRNLQNHLRNIIVKEQIQSCRRMTSPKNIIRKIESLFRLSA